MSDNLMDARVTECVVDANYDVFIRTVKKEPIEALRALATVYATLAGFPHLEWEGPVINTNNPLGLHHEWSYCARFTA